MQNNIEIKQFTGVKGMNKDLSSSFITSDTLFHMRNGTLFSHTGDYLSVQTEQSNKLVCTLPHPLMGHIKLPDGEWLLFTTDDVDSEIGTFNETTFKYTKVLNASWLNFNRSKIITGQAKELGNGEYVVYFADGRRNPDRRINLSKLSTANSDNTRLDILVKPPKIEIKKTNGGTLPNGNYQAAIRYSINSQPFGNVYSLTLPVSIWSETNNTGALNIKISALDIDFDFFELIVIQDVKNTSTPKIIGTYPKSTGNIYISSFDRAEYINIDPAIIPIQNQPWISSDQITGNNQYLFRKGVQTIPELNYQLQAFDIIPEYVVTRYNEDYYEYGDDKGHYRDEGYLYFIQWLHISGVYSSGFVTSGVTPSPQDLVVVTGSDVFETKIKECREEEKLPYWKIYNTAGPMISSFPDDDEFCDGVEIGHGKMGYYESTDVYPDNEIQFGKYAGTPVIVPHFPDEQKVPRYSIINGKAYINVLGIRFKNIPHPKKEDGSLDTDWIGYRIVRADRDGNRKVQSRMLLTNVRGYIEKIGNEEKEVLYTNYPINDLREDHFISQTQTTYKKNKEQNFTPLKTVYYDKFNAYSPHFTFSRYSLGDEIKIETEEVAEMTGHFREVYNHPKGKLLSLFSFWLAAAMGAMEALITVTGKTRFVAESELDVSLTGGTRQRFSEETSLRGVEDLIGLNPITLVANAVKAGSGISAVNVVKNIGLAIASLGLKILTFTFFGIQYADQVLDVIDKFLGYTNYALQFNGRASFRSQENVKKGSRRRHLSFYQYLQSGQQSVNNKLYNNFRKQDSVYLELNEKVDGFKNTDDSRKTITDAGIGNDIFKDFTSTGVAYYATSKLRIANQYGRVESIINFLLMHNNYYEAIPDDINDAIYSTSTIFGGDCYIVKDVIQTKHLFFTQDQSQPLYSEDGEEFNYLNYRNIGYPRFWANFFKYDFSELISKNVVNFTRFSNTVASRHNLDNKGKDRENKFRVDNAYFYTSSNCVLEYFVESDFNTHFREKSDNDTYTYSKKFTSIDEIFRSDRLLKQEQYKYDTSLNSKTNQIYVQQQSSDFDPAIFKSKYEYSKNRILYSLPSYQESKYDNWQYFLTGNQYEFPKSEFGNLISLHRVDGDRILFLFDRSSPYITLGQNQLQLKDGTEIEIGSGGLFAQPPRSVLYTEQMYGNCQSRWASTTNQFGTFFPSERQGRLFKFSNGLDELTRNGVQKWSSNYFPIKLLEKYPNFKHSDNPIIGVGYLISFDSGQETIYISKKDYFPREDREIEYNEISDAFTHNGLKVNLEDENYFDNLSFTFSYSPALNAFVSHHDWIPDWVIPTEKHFITSKGNQLWQHNNNPTSYGKYYGKQYPWEVGYQINNKFNVEIIDNIEYFMECYKFKPDGINKMHILDENFSHAIIWNSEQISGLLKGYKESNNPYLDVLYPKVNPLGWDVIFHKSENKYRINDFADITKDRQADVHLMHTHKNGWIQTVNPLAINPNKSQYELKDFRHFNTNVLLIKDVPNDVQMILKLALSYNTDSER